ncbi:unnamed protein product [Orchesella dallaii]|uniref:Uncharacterized protein n=1 Tax=Orchesella dallaii TaxID=48710 RepID=A0ABP1RIG6_9HEXA
MAPISPLILVEIAFLFTTIFPSLSHPATVQPLDLNSKLEIFKECRINVVINHVDLGENNKFLGSYETYPFIFPIILSFYRYQSKKKVKTKRITRQAFQKPAFYCGNRRVRLMPNQGFLFYAPPAPKSICFLQVYVAPKPCPEWEHNFVRPMYNEFVYQLFPKSFLNPSFDFKLGQEEFNGFGVDRVNLIFIFVQKKSYDENVYQSSVFTLVDYMWNKPFTDTENSVLPTKLLFEMEQSQGDDPAVMFSTSVFTCTDYQTVHKNLDKRCTKSRNKFYCLLFAVMVLWLWPQNIAYSGSAGITSWRQLQAYRSDCQNNLVITKMKHSPITNYNIYLSDWKHHEQVEVEPILIRMVCPNCTIVMDPDGKASIFEIFPQFSLYFSPSPAASFTLNTENNFVHFITCSPLEKPSYLSLIGYVSAFDVGTWIATLVAAIVSGRLWYVYVDVGRRKASRNFNKLFHACFVFNLLLGQGTSAIQKMRWITGSWIITGIVLTYFYQGDNINRLIAPLSSAKLQTFEEMLSENLTIHSPIIQESELKALYAEGTIAFENTSKYLTKLRDTFVKDLSPRTVFGSIYVKKQIKITQEKALSLLKPMQQTPETMEGVMQMFESGYFIQKISKCGRDVYVATLDNIERMKLKLQQHGVSRKRITTSTNAYGQVLDVWILQWNPWPFDVYTRRVRSLLQSGIAQLWKRWKFRVETWNDTVAYAKNITNAPKAVSTEDNAVVVFYLHAAFLCVALITFVLETKWPIYCFYGFLNRMREITERFKSVKLNCCKICYGTGRTNYKSSAKVNKVKFRDDCKEDENMSKRGEVEMPVESPECVDKKEESKRKFCFRSRKFLRIIRFLKYFYTTTLEIAHDLLSIIIYALARK